MLILVLRVRHFPVYQPDQRNINRQQRLSSLFNASSGMWNFIPKIEIPIFNAGRNQANLDIAEIRQQQSVVNYRTENPERL